MEENLDRLKSFVMDLHTLTDDEWVAFSVGWKTFNAPRKTILTASGETEKYLYFVLSGVQRAYFLGREGKEATIVFTYAPSFSGVADSMLTGKPSNYFFETLTKSEFLRVNAAELFLLIQQYPNIMHLILKAVSFALHGVLHRQAEVQVFSNEEKFTALLKRSPHLLTMIPHKYIASYLGIDPTNFSKLLASVKF
jgi:CRP-like cAMP-binding protein